jgi:hypothetical protein
LKALTTICPLKHSKSTIGEEKYSPGRAIPRVYLYYPTTATVISVKSTLSWEALQQQENSSLSSIAITRKFAHYKQQPTFMLNTMCHNNKEIPELQ